MRKLTILMAALLLAPVGLQADTLEDLLVEKGVITKGATDTARASMQAAKVYYKDGTVIEAPDAGFSLKLNVQLQERYTYQDNETGDSFSEFTTRRAKLVASGTALNKEFSYKLQTDFVGHDESGNGSRDPDLRDAYLVWHACDSAWVKMGQFKTFISRQEGTSSAKLQFAERSVASDFFAPDRDQGLAVGGDYEGLSWGLELLNGQSDGEGRNRPSFSGDMLAGVDTDHAGALTVRYDVMGEMDAFSEGDVENSDGNNLNVGFSTYYGSQTNSGIDSDYWIFNPDVSYKGGGLSVNAEYYVDQFSPDGTDSDFTNQGFYVQVGYFIDPSKWELAARYSNVDPDDDLFDDTDVEEWSGAINYYWWAHSLKAGFNYTHRTIDFAPGESGEDDTNLWIFQVSSWF